MHTGQEQVIKRDENVWLSGLLVCVKKRKMQSKFSGWHYLHGQTVVRQFGENLMGLNVLQSLAAGGFVSS